MTRRIAHALHFDSETVLSPWVKFRSADTLERALRSLLLPRSRLKRTGMRCGKPGREAVTSGFCRTGKTCFGSTGTSCDLLRHQSIEPLVAASRNVSVRVEDADHVLSTTVVRRGRFEGPDRAPGRAAEVAGLIDAGRGLEPLRGVRLLNVLVVGSLLLGGNPRGGRRLA
jgi:hypothetical protein